LGELRHRAGEVLALWTRENIGGAILAELSQISVRDLLPKHSDDVIAGHIVFAIVDAAGGIDSDGEVPAVPLPKVRLARERRVGGDGSFVALSHFRHGFTADDPTLGLKAVVNRLIVPAQCLG
jgi:hypothetical protein